MSLPKEIKVACENGLVQTLGKPVSVLNFEFVGGGSINEAGIVHTNEGGYFIKWNSSSHYPAMFTLEAKGLDILREAGRIHVPKTIFCGEAGGHSFIILEMIKSAPPIKNFWKDFGNSLADLHAITSDQFGLDHDNYIGALPQQNNGHTSWVDFFINERIQPQIVLARNGDKLDKQHVKSFEKVFRKLNEIFPEEQPSLLHGDLWRGNFMIGKEGRVTIFDPAVYYGHREAELAFSKMFGGFDKEFYDAYQERGHLEKTFDSRVDIYNMYPILVHLNLFGKSYLTSLEEILKRF